MSTRATYTFKPSQHDVRSKATTLYIHHDGYEEGAARYAYEVAAFTGPSKGGTVERWLRALPESAELTDSHDTHGDTEYRYTFTDNGTVVSVHKRIGWDGDKWSRIYYGNTADWINRTLGLDAESMAVTYQGRVAVVSVACAEVRHNVEQIAHQLKMGWIGNASGMLATVEAQAKGLVGVAELVATCKRAVDGAWEAANAKRAAVEAELPEFACNRCGTVVKRDFNRCPNCPASAGIPSWLRVSDMTSAQKIALWGEHSTRAQA